MLFEKIIGEEFTSLTKEYFKTDDVVIHRVFSFNLPEIKHLKLEKTLKIHDNIDYIYVTGGRNKNFQLNFGARVASLKKYPDTKFIIYTGYDNAWGEIILLGMLTKEQIKIRKEMASLIKKELPKDVSLPILDKELIDKVYQNTVGFVLKAKKKNIALQRGVLLHGEPGNGKSMLSAYLRSIASKNSLSIQNISATSINKSGGSISLAEVNIYDDIDINLFNRSKSTIAGELISKISGLDSFSKARCHIFTTNEPIDNIDPAYLRPERIDLVIKMELPNENLRRRTMLEFWRPEIIKQVYEENAIEWLVKKTEGYSFAKINAIQNIVLIHNLDNKYISIQDAYNQFLQDSSAKNETCSKKSVGF